MSRLQELFCILLHAFHVPQFVRRTVQETISRPGAALFRNLGEDPSLTASFNDSTARMHGRVAGASDSLWPFIARNLTAFIRCRFRHEFAINSTELIGGEAHELKVRIGVTGVFRHVVFLFHGADASTRPTDGFTEGNVSTEISIFEVGNQVPIAQRTFNQVTSTAIEDDFGFPRLRPIVNVVDATDDLTLRFVPSGNRHLAVRVRITIKGAAHGAGSTIDIGNSASGGGMRDRVTGNMRVTLSDVRYRVAVEEGDPCAEVVQ